MSLNDKIKTVISMRQMTPSHFADEIGVQRSSISHILSGRNRPSLEIIQRIVTRFPDITYEWLLENQESDQVSSVPTALQTGQFRNNAVEDKPVKKQMIATASKPVNEIEIKERSIQKILIFYSDNTFTEYTPSQ